MRFGIVMCFLLAPRCHPVASVRDFAAMLGCWDLFWSCYLAISAAFWHHVVLYARVQMPHPSPLCAILPPCYVVGVHFGGIVWLSWAHFGIILSFILASTSHYVAIAHDFVTMLRCWDSFSHYDALYARAQIHCVTNSPYFYAMLRCWDLFWSCYLPILDAFWYHVAL